MKQFRAYLRPYQNVLLRLCLIEFFRGLSILGMAAAMTEIIESVLSEIKTEAAPIFLALLFSMVCRVLLEYLAEEQTGALSAAVQFDCRKKLHRKLCGGSSEPVETGRLLTLALETVESFDEAVCRVLPDLISCLVLLPLLFFVILLPDPLTAGLFLLTLPVAPILLYLIGRVTRERNAEAWREQGRLTAGFHELLRGVTTLKMFGQLNSAAERLRTLSETSAEAALRVLQLAFLSAFALELATTLSIALIAVNVGLRLLYGSLEFFPAFLALLLAPEFYRPIRQGGASFHAAMKAKEAADALRYFLAEKEPLPRETHVERTRMPPGVTAEGLRFCYPGQISPVLNGLDLTLEAGTTTVLAGTSGSGKSTLLALLAGQAEPQQGRIAWNGLPASQMDRGSFYRCIAYVPQEPYVFQAALRDNLTMFCSVEEKKVWEALETAGLADWAKKLPLGLDTEMGGLGRNGLSRGQLHRLGFARAVLQDPYFLLLDEVTAGLDEEGERQMLRALEKFCYRRTVLMTAHRRAVLEQAPRILLLDGGKVAAEGRYEDLKEILMSQGTITEGKIL